MSPSLQVWYNICLAWRVIKPWVDIGFFCSRVIKPWVDIFLLPCYRTMSWYWFFFVAVLSNHELILFFCRLTCYRTMSWYWVFCSHVIEPWIDIGFFFAAVLSNDEFILFFSVALSSHELILFCFLQPCHRTISWYWFFWQPCYQPWVDIIFLAALLSNHELISFFFAAVLYHHELILFRSNRKLRHALTLFECSIKN